MSEQVELHNDLQSNPLDCVEDILDSNNWIYSRTANEELIVDVSGKDCHYRLTFLWQEHLNALQLCCQYNLHIAEEIYNAAALTILEMNEALWMGHFELSKDTLAPRYRHTCFITEDKGENAYNHIEDLVDVSLTQCERFHHVFQILAHSGSADTQTLSLAMMETQGDA